MSSNDSALTLHLQPWEVRRILKELNRSPDISLLVEKLSEVLNSEHEDNRCQAYITEDNLYQMFKGNQCVPGEWRCELRAGHLENLHQHTHIFQWQDNSFDDGGE